MEMSELVDRLEKAWEEIAAAVSRRQDDGALPLAALSELRLDEPRPGGHPTFTFTKLFLETETSSVQKRDAGYVPGS
jgi:hypothetical protein